MLKQPAHLWLAPLATVILATASSAHADVVTDSNAKAAEIASKIPGTRLAVRAMAIVQVSVFEAANAITGRYPASSRVKVVAAPGASVDAAVSAATRTALLKLVPAQQAAIDADYQAALRLLPDSRAKSDGIAVGEQVATAVFESCASDRAVAPNTYRPHGARRCLCADGIASRASLGETTAMGDDERRPVSPRSAAQLDQRCVEAGLRRNQRRSAR